MDLVLDQWHERRPDLDVSPMAVLGRLSRLSRLVEGEQRRTFARHGLDRATFDVLATLRRNAPPHALTPTELMRSCMVTSSAITQRLDKLEARGLVARAPSDVDGRGVVVALTPRGYELIDAVMPDHVATGQRLLAALDTAERAALATTLRALLESLEGADG